MEADKSRRWQDGIPGKLRWVPFLLALHAGAASALASREDLEKWCAQGTVAAAGRCLGYLLAAEDALSQDSIEGVRACLPRDISLQEQHRIVTEWLRDNPHVATATAMGSVARAYASRYPCK